MSRDIQQGSDSVSSPLRSRSHSESNQVSPEDQQKWQLKSVRFVKDAPESCQDPDPQIRPASVDLSQRDDSVPYLEASSCTTGSMTAENAQANQDSDAEPDACIPGTYGYDSVPSVSKDYVPWFETETDSYEGGIIVNLSTFLICLSGPFFVVAVTTMAIQQVAFGSGVAFLKTFRWTSLIGIGGVFDGYLLSLVKLGLAFHSDVTGLKAAFGNGFWGLIKLIAYSVLNILVCLGILVGTYYAPSAHSYMFVAWHTGTLPQSFRGCEARVGPAQSSLFTEHIYASQFARIQNANSSADSGGFLEFDMQAFDAIRHDQILCNQGFIGISDLYGLGSRVSLYLQWLTALLVNNFVPRIRNEFRKVYLAYSLGLCIATFVFTFSTACTFAVEVEILYWAYWGGYLCIFATSPSYTRLGSKVKWIGLDWMTGINYLLHILMFYHSTFFWQYGYDQVFSRMPCGTYHFFFAPILDPSKSFWFLRDALTVMITPVNIVLGLVIPTVSLGLMCEIKESICDSSVYQNLGIYLKGSGRPNSERVLAVDAAQVSLSSRSRNSLSALGFFCVRLYRWFREMCLLLPPHSRGGIRLLTPLDIKQRKCVIVQVNSITK